MEVPARPTTRRRLTWRKATGADLDCWAALQAASPTSRRVLDPALPAAYADVAAACELLRSDPATALGQGGDDGCGLSVVALRGETFVGYRLARIADADAHPVSFDGWALRGRAAVVTLAACAASPNDLQRCDLLRRLSAAAGTRWLEAGPLAHYVRLPDADPHALEAFWSRGLRRMDVRLVRHFGQQARAAEQRSLWAA